MHGHGDKQQAASAGRPEAGGGTAKIPPVVRRAWDAAAAELSALVFADPVLYERTMTLVRRTADALRSRGTDLAELLSASDHAEDEAVAAARAAGIPAVGMRLDLIAAAALSLRARELAGESVLRHRLAQLALARAQRRTWALVEESGDQAAALVLPYRRVDVHLATGVALIASAEPDEAFTRVVYRLQWGRIDLATGLLTPDEDRDRPPVAYPTRQAWEAARTEVLAGSPG